MKSAETRRIVFVTGLSGAGMSSALGMLQDLGYEVFDNFPLSLVEPLLNDTAAPPRPIAFGIDSRSRGFDPRAVMQASERLGAALVFLTADEGVLQKRFTETRRRHPLAEDRPVSAGIKKEQSLLHPMKDLADPIIDTTELSIHDLRRVIAAHFSLDDEPTLSVTVMSFGFKHGIPRESDIVMDVRFLRNPHWVDALRPLTGLDAPVAKYVEEDGGYHDFISDFKTMIAKLLPRYRAEGKSYLTLAIGCTGGHHRSVHIAQVLAGWLESQGVAVSVDHRDIER
jgi:UPF0042 nucleotide-binding protein